MFFLIWGFRSRIATLERGTFACPVCVKQQPFELRQMARWFTLFFIPLLRTRMLGEYVFCLGCRNSLKRGVLASLGAPAVAPVPALQGLVDALPRSLTTSAPASAAPPAPAARSAAARRAALASDETLPMVPRPAALEALRNVTRPAASDGQVVPGTPISSFGLVMPEQPEQHEPPAFGQSAFAKATYARQRRPAPQPFGAPSSEPAFFTPRR